MQEYEIDETARNVSQEFAGSEVHNMLDDHLGDELSSSEIDKLHHRIKGEVEDEVRATLTENKEESDGGTQ